jgi:hypothetical protein
MNLFKLFAKKDNNQLKIQKSESGEDWVVKKGYSTLYIGTKEKCKIFVKQGLSVA